MDTYQTTYTNLLFREIRATPDEYLPALLNIVRIFRETIALKPAEESFRQGWKEAVNGETMPVNDLWTTDIDDE
jgi:hypothetical protein